MFEVSYLVLRLGRTQHKISRDSHGYINSPFFSVCLSVTFVLIQIVCDYSFLGPAFHFRFCFHVFPFLFFEERFDYKLEQPKTNEQNGEHIQNQWEKTEGGKNGKKMGEKNLWKHEGNQMARGTSGLPSAPHAPPLIFFPGAGKHNFHIKIEQNWQNLNNKLPNIKLSINLKKSPLKCFSERYAILDCVAGGFFFNLSRRLSICCGVSQSVAMSLNLLRYFSICRGVPLSVAVSLNLLRCFSICCRYELRRGIWVGYGQ